jgi:hypothetical protein
VLCALLFADGGVFVPSQWEVYEAGQVAIIKLKDRREELSLATRFTTEASSLAWLVPLPGEPEVDSVGIERFNQLAGFCAPIYRQGYGLSCGAEAPPPERGYGDSTGVWEVGSGIIGDFTWVVVQAYRADTLLRYLTGHGYALPDGTRDAFEHYLRQSWNYFFVARVSDTTQYYYYDRNLGIRLSFPCDSIVYPLYISRISSQASEIVFYVLAEHRQMFRGGQLRFSGRVGADDFPGFLDQDYHLTKLTKVFAPEQMDDICFRNAPDDQDYREIRYSGSYGIGLLGLVMVVFLFFRPWGRLQLRTGRRRTPTDRTQDSGQRGSAAGTRSERAENPETGNQHRYL